MHFSMQARGMMYRQTDDQNNRCPLVELPGRVEKQGLKIDICSQEMTNDDDYHDDNDDD